MKSVTFLEGALVALLLALGGAALLAVLVPLCGLPLARLALGLLLALAYLLYVLARRERRGGRALTLVAWSALAIAIACFAPGLLAFAIAQVLLLSLCRALLWRRGPLAALGDLALAGLALVAAAWAWLATGSTVAALWTLGLVQAAHVWLPARRGAGAPRDDTHFARSARSAERALAQLRP